MAKLSVSEYFKVKKLVSSNHSISVFSVMDGDMPGKSTCPKRSGIMAPPIQA
jgi:hypothetical protein